MGFRIVCLVIFLSLVSTTEARKAVVKVFNVREYGAVADGKTDNSQVLLKVWDEACKLEGYSRIRVPRGTYMTGYTRFYGPCKGKIAFHLEGILKASTDYNSLHNDTWVAFQNVDALTLAGGGSFEGQGPSAWKYNNCAKKSSCMRLPANLRFDFLTNSEIHHINSYDSKNLHMNLFGCKNVYIHNVNIKAPGDSPNTDGIHIGRSSDIKITDSDIGTGDDCISLSPGSINVSVSNVHCGPGHGISVGSIGGTANEGPISGLHVKNCTFTGTDNGLRIKTWAPSSPGKVFDITFEDIVVDNVKNPVIIDQQYCPSRKCDTNAASSIQIEDVKFRDIRGTTRSKVGVNLLCSSKYPCQKVELKNIDLVYNGKDGHVLSSCSHVKGVALGKQNPRPCV